MYEDWGAAETGEAQLHAALVFHQIPLCAKNVEQRKKSEDIIDPESHVLSQKVVHRENVFGPFLMLLCDKVYGNKRRLATGCSSSLLGSNPDLVPLWGLLLCPGR